MPAAAPKAAGAASWRPVRLTAVELVGPFEAAGLRLVSLEETRFDPTPAYGAVPPLAWCALFEAPPARALA